MITAEDLKRFAKEIRVDLIGIANIERFKDVPPEHNPLSIFPETKSVIVIGRRITRGTLRGIEEGTNFDLYYLYGRDWLNNRILAMSTFKIGEFLEDNGWEAVPIPNLPLEVPPLGIPVREGQPAPNVMIDVEDCALKAGLGEIGHCGFFLTSEFGPRQRFQIILTDLELEADPLFEGKVCNYPVCPSFCPLGAINPEGKIDYKKCQTCKNGATPNPLHSSGKPDRLGAVCARSCLDYLERNNLIKNTFKNPFRTKPARFKNAPKNMHPASIFPSAKSVIVVGKRILRGGWRGVEEGTYWPSYTYFDYHGLLNTLFIPYPLYELACFLEDHGWEAVPYYPGSPETQPSTEPLRKNGVPPNVHLAMRIAATAAGLGEIGWSKVFLTKKFGPRQRLHAIITDMPIDPDPLVEPGSICKRDMACVSGCPGAILHIKEGKTVRIEIEDKVYEWADIDLGKCTLAYHGGDPRVSPFIHKDLPGFNFDVTEQEVDEETAYKICWTLSTARWRVTKEFPSGYIIEGHALLQKWGEGGSYGICVSRGCMRSCFDYLESAGIIEQQFNGGRFIKRPRWLLPSKVEKKR